MRTIGKALVLAMVVSGIAVLSVAQTAQKGQFEVASIKQATFPSDASFAGMIAAVGACGQTRLAISGNRVNLRQVSLCSLVAMAYDIRDYLIMPGSNDWLKKEDRTLFYEVQATAPDDAAQLAPARAREMLQTLLAERLQLKVHREMREVPIYVLAVGKNGAKFKLNPSGPCAQHPNASIAFGTSFGPGGQRRGADRLRAAKV